MQSQHQTPSIQNDSSQDLVSGASVCQPELDAPQLSGNQAALDEAGLSDTAQAGSGLGDILSYAAGVVLDAMPMSLALQTAYAFLHLDGVCEWLDQQPMVQVATAIRDSQDGLISTLWPEGVGFTYEGAIGGALLDGIDFRTMFTLVRTGEDTLQADYLQQLCGSMEGGLNARREDAFGQSDGAVGGGGALKLIADVQGNCTTEFDICGYIEAMLLQPLAPLSAIFKGTAATFKPLPGAVEGMVPQDPQGWDTRMSLIGQAEASHSTAVDVDLDSLNMLLGSTVSGEDTAASTGAPGLAEASVGLLGRMGLKGRVGIEVGSEGVVFFGGLSAEVIAALDAALPAVASIPGWGGLRTDPRANQAGSELGLRLSLRAIEGADGSLSWQPMGANSEISLSSTRSMSDDQGKAAGTLTDTTTMSIADYMACQMAGTSPDRAPTIAQALASAGTSFTRQLQIPVDQATLDRTFPDILRGCVGLLGLPPGVDTLVEAELVGSLVASSQALSSLAGAGIEAPANVSSPEALTDIGQSLIALRCGGEVSAAWLAPYKAQLLKAAGSVSIEKARLVGSIRAGVGAKVEAAVGVQVGAEARANGGIAIDRALSAEQAALLQAAAA